MREEKVEIQEIENTEESEMHRVLELAMEAGRILLSNGAEIFRVEETIWHICNRFNIEEMDAFVLSNGIFLTAYSKGKETFARVKHVPLAGTRLDIVTEVNDLSREIAAGHVGIEEAFARLEEIKKMPAKADLVQILAAGMGSGAFCYLIAKNAPASCAAFVIGSILYVLVLFAQKHKMSKIITNIVGGAFITVMALIVSKLPLPFEMGLDEIIIGSILPLIPGVGFVNAIRDIAGSDFISGIVRMLDALLVFVYIAIGVGCVLSVYEEFWGGVRLCFSI